MLGIRNKRGQVTKEFAILVGIIAAALIAMQTYVKRGLQGRLKNLADQVHTRQYEPTDTDSSTATRRSGGSHETEHLGTYTLDSQDTTTVNTSQVTVER